MATSKRGRRSNQTAVNSRKILVNRTHSDIVKIFAERDTETPIKKMKVKVKTTKRLTKDMKEFILDGHPRRQYAIIAQYASIDPPKRYIGRLKRKPQPFRWV